MLRSHKSPTWKRLVASYLIILTIAILTTAILSSIASDALNREMERIALMNVSQMQGNSDNSIMMLQSIATTLSYKSEIVNATNARISLGQTALNLANVQTLLTQQQLNNSTVGNICVLYPNENIIVTPQYAYNDAMVDIACHRFFGLDFGEVCQMLQQSLKEGVSLYHDTQNGIDRLIAVAPAINLHYACSAYVVVELEQSALQNLLTNYEHTAADFAILTHASAFAMGIDCREIYELTASLPEGIFDCRQGRNPLIVAVKASSISSFRYAALVLRSEYMNEIRIFQRCAILCLTISFIVGLAISLFLAKHNLQPLNRLMSMVSESGDICQDEFEHLENALIDLIRKKRAGEEIQQRYDIFTRKYLIGMLLEGKIRDESSFWEANERLSLGISGNRFCVGTVHIENRADYMHQEQISEEVLWMTIHTVVEHEAAGQVHVVSTLLDDSGVYILCLPEHWDESPFRALDWNEAIQILDEQFGLKTRVCISSEQDGLAGISKAYLTTQDLLECAEMYGVNHSLFCEGADMESDPSAAPFMGYMETEKLVISCILSQDYMHAAQNMLDILKMQPPMGAAALEALRHMLRTAVLTLENTRSLFPKEFFDSLDVRKRFLAASTINDVRAAVEEVFGALDQHVHNRDAKMQKVAHKICEYLEQNYANPLLSRTYVAEQLNLSVSYLSHVLKEQKGVTVMDLIHQRRITVAKDLLSTTGFSLQEVAEQVGYTNTWTFSRAFKNIEGTSPGKYR